MVLVCLYDDRRYFFSNRSSNSRNFSSFSISKGPTYFSSDLNVKAVELKCPKAECMNERCLHDAVIIDVPCDPHAADIARDYTLFIDDERQIQSEYIKAVDLFSAINS